MKTILHSILLATLFSVLRTYRYEKSACSGCEVPQIWHIRNTSAFTYEYLHRENELTENYAKEKHGLSAQMYM